VSEPASSPVTAEQRVAIYLAARGWAHIGSQWLSQRYGYHDAKKALELQAQEDSRTAVLFLEFADPLTLSVLRGTVISWVLREAQDMLSDAGLWDSVMALLSSPENEARIAKFARALVELGTTKP